MPSTGSRSDLYDDDSPGLCPPGVLQLDGINDFATFTQSLWPNTGSLATYTLEAWIRPHAAPGLRFIAADDAFDFDFTASSVEHALYGPTASFAEAGTPSGPVLNAWNHVAISFDAGSGLMRVALNGILSPAVPFGQGGFYSDPSQTFTLGARRLSPKAPAEGFFEGQIDEVRLSDSIRYPSNFLPATRLETDNHTRALYHFDEPAGATFFSDSLPLRANPPGGGWCARAFPSVDPKGWTRPRSPTGP